MLEEERTDKVDIRTQKIVDDREPDLIKQQLLTVGWTQQRLFSADYKFYSINYKAIGVERKELNDFVNSLGDRLSRQLENMLEHYNVSILLIEGSWKMVGSHVATFNGVQQWGWTLVWNYLRTWQDRGITLELTTNAGHTIKRVNELYAYYSKTSHTGGYNRSIVGDPRILALQCGGIGPKLGELLIKKFGSLKNMANANLQDFLATDGIGSKKATSLYNHFNRNNETIE